MKDKNLWGEDWVVTGALRWMLLILAAAALILFLLGELDGGPTTGG